MRAARDGGPRNVSGVFVHGPSPLNPVISLVVSNSSSAQISWSSYSPPADLGSFRVYLSTNNFSSVTGLAPVSSVGGGTRSYIFGGLTLDRTYYAAVTAVDAAGNSSPQMVGCSTCAA